MMKFIKKNFGNHKKDTESYNSIYDFFVNCPEDKKKGLFMKAIKESNKEQRELIERYDKTIGRLQKN